MPEQGFLRDLTVLLAGSVPILFLCRKLRLPPILGFLVTGVVAGPHALGVLRDTRRVGDLAEMGVVLILFFVGLEFPLGRLKALGRAALAGGTAQMSLAVVAVAGPLLLWGEAPGAAVFDGILISISSTAVVLPILAARDELAAPHARRFLGVALYQDLAVIPLMLLLPALAAGGGPGAVREAVLRVGAAVVGVALLVVASRFVAPRFLALAVKLGSREGFTASVIVVVLGMVLAAERAGVSAAMGAFAAGIVLAESEFIHDVVAALSPFRDLLSSLFFVSIGMLLDPAFLVRRPLVVLLAVALVTALKTATAYVALRMAWTVPRTALRSALALASVGEFSFVLARAGQRLGLLGPDEEQLFVAIAVLTLALAPVLISLGPRLAVRLKERVEEEVEPDEHAQAPLAGHVIVAGYGLNGRNVARVLSETGIPHVVIDADQDRVALARRTGSRALRAEATGVESLLAAGVERAVAIVVAFSDAEGTRRTVRLARQKNPLLRIIVRTRYVSEVEALREAGADEVIPEEFETSIEIVARVLRVFRLPGNVVAAQLRLLRDEAYRLLRDEKGRVSGGRRLAALMAAGTTELFLVLPDTAAEGRTLAELHLESEHVSVPALLRDGTPFAPPPQEEPIASGDTLLLVGAHEDLARVVGHLETKRVP